MTREAASAQVHARQATTAKLSKIQCCAIWAHTLIQAQRTSPTASNAPEDISAPTLAFFHSLARQARLVTQQTSSPMCVVAYVQPVLGVPQLQSSQFHAMQEPWAWLGD